MEEDIATGSRPEGRLLIRTLAMPADTNPRGDIFGGWIVSQMDLAGLGLAQETADARATTVSIERMSFLQPVRVGDFICCYGKLLEIGRTSMRIGIEVYAIGHRETDRRQVTKGIFTYVAIDEKGSPIPVMNRKVVHN